MFQSLDESGEHAVAKDSVTIGFGGEEKAKVPSKKLESGCPQRDAS